MNSPKSDIRLVRSVPFRYSKEARERDGAHGPFEAEVRAQGYLPSVTITVTEDGKRDRVMFADGIPVQLAVSTYAGIGPGSDPGIGGSMSRQAEAGWPQIRWAETITTRFTTNDEAEVFGRGHVYVIRHSGYSQAGVMLEYTECILPCDIWTLEYEWTEGKDESDGKQDNAG